MKEVFQKLKALNLSPKALMLYVHLAAEPEKKSSQAEILKSFKIFSTTEVTNALIQLSEQSLISGSPQAFAVLTLPDDKNAPTATQTRLNAGLKVSDIVKCYRDTHIKYLKHKMARHSEDFATLRKLCRARGTAAVKAEILKWFASGIYKQIAPAASIEDFAKYLRKAASRARV